MQSLSDASSAVCGFRMYRRENAIGLVTEWSHSLNMLDIDISSIYREVCGTMANGTSKKDIELLDVIVSCDKSSICICFMRNLRNRTAFMPIDSSSMFYAMTGQAISDIVINACVWDDIMRDSMRAILHLDHNSTSCCFRFGERRDTFLVPLTESMVVRLVFSCLALCLFHLLVMWGPITGAICQYVLPIFHPHADTLSYCTGHV